jgi:hypothetical protein
MICCCDACVWDALPEGALPHIERIRAIAQPELGWDDARWQQELKRYEKIYQAYTARLPPDWKNNWRYR